MKRAKDLHLSLQAFVLADLRHRDTTRLDRVTRRDLGGDFWNWVDIIGGFRELKYVWYPSQCIS